MTKEDRSRADARFNKVSPGKAGKPGTEQDVAAKAVLDNMARLKALRLAREATEPPRPAATVRKTRTKKTKPDEKAPALSQWLAGQQSGGRRT
jgi:hypothetical protein